MGTTERGQDNSVCEMHSRGLPISAGKMSGPEWSGVTELPRTTPDVLYHGWVAKAAGGDGFLFILICGGWSWPFQGRRIEEIQGSEFLTEKAPGS